MKPVSYQALAVVSILTIPLLATDRSPIDGGMLASFPSRNRVSDEKGLPSSFDLKTGHNVKWVAALGSEAYAGPVVAGGKVLVGTNNEAPRDPKVTGDRGVVMAFAAGDGAFLWQAVHDKLAVGRSQDWPGQGVCSTPAIDGDRAYYLSNRGEIVAVDLEGFRDGENDGPFTKEATAGPGDADQVWKLDLIGELGVVPRFMTASSPLVAGDLVFAGTSNGPGEGRKVTAPQAPSFVAVDRSTGKLRWSDASPGANLLDGQWGSPAYGVVAGRAQVVFPGGDGWVYSFAPDTGKLLWKFDANRPLAAGGERGRDAIVGAPVVHGDRVYVGVGHDPEAGSSDGRLWAIDATLAGDVTEKGAAWSLGGEDFATTLSTVAIADGVLYAADLAGFLHALDAASGKPLWKYDTFAAVWGSPLVADGKVYLGDEDGDLVVLAAGREMKKLAEVNLGNAIYTAPVAKGGVLYVVTASKLFAFAEKSASP